MTDRFEDMRTFVAVAQHRSFNTAADRLGLGKSAVSRRIRDLEDRLGTRLINRTTRQLSLTEAGTLFYERCTKLLTDLQEAEDTAAKGSAEVVGHLRISAPVSFTTHCLAPIIGEFLTKHPRVTLAVEMNDRFVDIVSEGYDIALRIGQLKDSSLIARRIAPIRHVVCASPTYLEMHGRPLQPEDLRSHKGITYSNVDPTRNWLFRDNQSVEVPNAILLNNGDAIREVAIAGYGITILPTFIVYKAIARGELEIVLAEYERPAIALYAVYPSSRNVSAKVRLFIDFLVEKLGDKPFWDQGIEAAGPQTVRSKRTAHRSQ
jgi:DNA-binding transcriptional LysR family regulator